MINKIDKRDRAKVFRERLIRAMEAANMTQSGLSRAIGVDRSTISQLLTGTGARLPNAQVVGECAAALNVSSDWLLSLSDNPESAETLIANALSLENASRSLVDEQIFDWHREAEGYKIRHAPAGLPDMFKSDPLLEWEYAPHIKRTQEQAISATQDRLNWMRSSKSDYEIIVPLHEMISFARAEGYYSDLPIDIRLAQIDRFLELSQQLYPRARLYLYDGKETFSSPLTVFGPLMATIYIGHHYIVFRDNQKVELLSQHFDQIVSIAQVSTRGLADFFGRYA